MPKSIFVSLSGDEIWSGAIVGLMRRIMDIKNNRKDKNKGRGGLQSWQSDIEGAIGELVFAKHYGLFWAGVGKIGEVDFGKLTDVKATSYDNGRLCLQKDANPHWRYVLVTGDRGKYAIRGWLWGHEAMLPKYLDDPTGKEREAHFAPQEDLHDMDLLTVEDF
jgi:hypothetical protein